MAEKKKIALASRKRGPARAPKISGRKVSVATREAMNVREASRSKTQDDVEVIGRALSAHFIFTSLA